jgi:carboxylesterase type B
MQILWKMQQLKLLLFLFSQICLNTGDQLQQTFAPIINLSYGSIRGTVLSTNTSTNQETFAYLGVPFVHPPINELRFKPPKSIDGNSEVCLFKIYTKIKQLFQPLWSGILNAAAYGPACLQNVTLRNNSNHPKNMSEDCLTVNILTSKYCLSSSTKCPVLYYVHGGGFVKGAASDYPLHVLDQNFARKNIVFVSVQYRLGVFGFWKTAKRGTNGIGGNYQTMGWEICLK